MGWRFNDLEKLYTLLKEISGKLQLSTLFMERLYSRVLAELYKGC